MNNTVIRKVVVAAEYAALASKRTVASCDISCPPGNAAVVYFQGDDGSDVPWIPGEWHPFVRVDLSTIKVKGTPGDVVTVNGGTW